jgi:hypothetical protein
VNSISCNVWLDVGDIGGIVWFGAPIMHNMFGLSLAKHWHGMWEHVHGNSHSGTVISCDRLLRCPALALVRNLVFIGL